jgi:hypothetical protein
LRSSKRRAPQSLSFSKVPSQLIVAVVMEAFDGGVLDGPVHPFDLAVGPRMIGLRQPVLDAIPEADAIEHLEAQPCGGPFLREGGSQN